MHYFILNPICLFFPSPRHFPSLTVPNLYIIASDYDRSIPPQEPTMFPKKQLQYTLVPDSSDALLEPPSPRPAPSSINWRLRFYILLALLFISLATLSAWVIYPTKSAPCYPTAPNVKYPYCTSPSLVSLHNLAQLTFRALAPAQSHVRYMNKWPHRDPDMHRFMGKPRPELDDAWHELLDSTPSLRKPPHFFDSASTHTEPCLAPRYFDPHLSRGTPSSWKRGVHSAQRWRVRRRSRCIA